MATQLYTQLLAVALRHGLGFLAQPLAAVACLPPDRQPAVPCLPLNCLPLLPQEWDDFILCLKTPLPITFRINGGGQFADRLREKLETDFMAQFAAGETLMVRAWGWPASRSPAALPKHLLPCYLQRCCQTGRLSPFPCTLVLSLKQPPLPATHASAPPLLASFPRLLSPLRQVDGEPAEPPHPLGWYPGGLAWQMSFSRKQLRKAPVLAELHEFMKRENEVRGWG